MKQIEVAALDVAELREAVAYRAKIRLFLRRVARMPKISNSGNSGLLRAGRGRPARQRGAKKRDELAAPHSKTSSAAITRPGGTAMPSALAVLRLMYISTFEDRCTGISAGFSPVRTRPV
jgi:hypothetical protein